MKIDFKGLNELSKRAKKLDGENIVSIDELFSKEFLESFNELFKVGSPIDIEIKAPAIDLDKDEIVKLGAEFNAPMELSYSCYKGTENHCGVCESCMRRKRGFKKAGIEDLTIYTK